MLWLVVRFFSLQRRVYQVLPGSRQNYFLASSCSPKARLTTIMKTLLKTLFVGLALTSMTLAAQAETRDGVELAKVQHYRLMTAAPNTLDPSLYSYSEDLELGAQLYDTLVQQAPNGDYVPVAAASYDVSEDGLTYTFHLRPDGKWSDGQPVRAQDFVYSWRRLVDPKTGSPYGAYLGDGHVVNALDVNNGKLPVDQLGVEAKDDLTFVVHLTQPTPWFPLMTELTSLAPLRQDKIEQYGKDWVQPGNLVSNGAFYLAEYKPREGLKLKKNPYYWNADKVALTQVQYDTPDVLDPKVGYFRYLNGESLSTSVPAPFKAKVDQERPGELQERSGKTGYFMQFNLKKVNKDLRQAFALAWDAEFIARKLYNNGRPIPTFLPEGLPDAELVKGPDWFNLPQAERNKRAQELLKSLGYTKANPAKLKYLVVGKPDSRAIGTVERLKLNTDGLLVLEFDVVADYRTASEREKAGNFEVAVGGWGADYNHVSNFMAIWRCGSPLQHSGYCNPEYDKLVDQANSTLDVQKRRELYAQAVSVLDADVPYSPDVQQSTKFLLSPRLGGWSDKVETNYFKNYYITTKTAKDVPARDN